MGPHLLLDKSSLQSLSHDELDIMRRYFFLVVPPILLVEILGDLKKDTRKKGHPSVAGLARRIAPGNTLPILNGFQELIKAEIGGVEIKMDFRPIILGGKSVKAATGERGHILEVQPEAQVLAKWQQNRFEEAEEILAARYRDTLRSMDVGRLQKFLHGEYSPRLNLTSLAEAEEFVDDLIEGGDPKMLLSWFFHDAFGDGELLTDALSKLPKESRLEARLPYTTFCLRVSLIFHFGLAFNLVSTRPSNRIDLEYLFYLPFTRGFSSGDKLHHEFFEMVGLKGNNFVGRDDLKEDLKRLLEYEKENPESAKLTHPPDLAPDSFTSMMWRKLMKPATTKRGELMEQLSPEQEKRLLERILKLADGIEDPEQVPEEKQDFLIRKYEMSAKSPCICGSGKPFGECCGKDSFPQESST